MRRFVKLVALLACTVWCPAAAYAQASITGVVRDTSGAVLPGVTVEASSDVLIEKTRTAVTDSTGQLSDRRSAGRHLRGDVHAHRVLRPSNGKASS